MANHSAVMDKRYVLADDEDKCSIKTRRGERDFQLVYDCDKRLKREIANSNERRRMQSINTGFEDLRRLLPVASDGERLSKAAILQLTAKYIQTILLRLSTLEKEVACHHKSAPVTIPCEHIRKRRLNSGQGGEIDLNSPDRRNFSQPMNQETDTPGPQSLANKKTPAYPPTNLRPPFHHPHNQRMILRPSSPNSPNQETHASPHLPNQATQVYLPTFHHSTNQNMEPSSADDQSHVYPQTNQTPESPHSPNHKSQSYPPTNQNPESPLSPNQMSQAYPQTNQKTGSPHSSNQKLESPHSSNQKTPGSLEHLVAAIEQVEGEQFYLGGPPPRGERPQGDCAVMRPTISPFTEKIILAVSRHPHMFPRAPSHPAHCPSHPHGNQTL